MMASFSGTHNSTGFSYHDAARAQQYDGLFFSGTHNSTGFSFHDAARAQQYYGLFFQVPTILQVFHFMTQRELSLSAN